MPHAKRLFICLMIAMLSVAACGAALGESYSASSMRLVQYEGTVEILDESGSARFMMPNARLGSGDAVVTGPDGAASISLDSEKVLTLDADSRVELEQKGSALKLKLVEGSLFLDVREKLGEDETLDIETSNITVGIRGTIVFLNTIPSDEGSRADSCSGVCMPITASHNAIC